MTANERRGPESDPIGTAFAPPHRARRIEELLGVRTGLTTADFAAIHNDTLLATVPVLTALVPGAFDDFDARMEADSPAAARFAAWRSALVRRLVAEPALAPLLDPPAEHRHDPLFAGWVDPTFRIALALPTLAAAGTPFGIDLAALGRAALAEVEAAGEAGDLAGTWGDTHVFAPVHAFDTLGRAWPGVPEHPVSGDSDCVRCCSSYPAQDDVCSRGSVARYVWDLADRTRGGWVVPTGAAGDLDDPHHHDQLDAWVAGELLPIVTDWDQLTEVAPD